MDEPARLKQKKAFFMRLIPIVLCMKMVIGLSRLKRLPNALPAQSIKVA